MKDEEKDKNVENAKSESSVPNVFCPSLQEQPTMLAVNVHILAFLGSIAH